LEDATDNFYPDYDLDWILRTDASENGCGGVLIQLRPDPATGIVKREPIAFISHKFSDQAYKWDTISKECFGMVYCVKKLQYYLHAKNFTLETDHQNLRFLERSEVPKLIRWKLFLQSYIFILRHIRGAENIVADWQSRLYLLQSAIFQVAEGQLFDMFAEEQLRAQFPTLDECIQSVHGSGSEAHGGIVVTWRKLNKTYPGHHIPYSLVYDYVMTCPTCQKVRLAALDSVPEITRTLKPEHQRSLLGIDVLTISPPDEDGHNYMVVIVNQFTKLVTLWPIKSKDATEVAECLLAHISFYGSSDEIISDPGSEFIAEVFKVLTEWLGVTHKLGLVARHESNGVEDTNKHILRHLVALLSERRWEKNWGSRRVTALMQMMVNTATNIGIGEEVSPMELTLGTHDKAYYGFSPNDTPAVQRHKYIKTLDEDLDVMRKLSTQHQKDLIAERKKDNLPDAQRNMYQKGDFILVRYPTGERPPDKITPKWRGPWEVTEHVKNDVSCRHVNLGHIEQFPADRCKYFHGTKEAAQKVAMWDQRQYVVQNILAYRGDPEARTTMEFLVLYEDGDKRWITYCNDLARSEPFFDYVRRTPALYPLTYDSKNALKMKQEINRTVITEVQPGDIIFVDIRSYGAEWYRQMRLPDQDLTTYMTRCLVRGWVNQTRRKVEIQDELYGDTTIFDHWAILRHGRDQSLPAGAVLLTRNDFAIYPQLDHTTWMSDHFADPTIDAQPQPSKPRKSGRKKG
jgi:hypothetical protein